jgi:hypothetical protein
MKELEKDMTMLRAGMKEVGREIEFYRGQPVQHGDRYKGCVIPLLCRPFYFSLKLSSLFNCVCPKKGASFYTDEVSLFNW